MENRDRKIGLVFNDVARFRGILFDQMLHDDGVTHVQAFVLDRLFKQDGLTQTELSERMDIGTVTVSGLVDRLEAKGWVERKPDSKDRRAKRVWLTSKVGNIRKKMSGCITQLNDVTLDGMEDSEIDQLVDLLKKAKINLANKLCKGPQD
ncbi:MAG: MarR family transcriptional regulator [Rhodospirillales bacterium]|nr:MarR family transcriptional regulator [Rhodospirillales bacterium]